MTKTEMIRSIAADYKDPAILTNHFVRDQVKEKYSVEVSRQLINRILGSYWNRGNFVTKETMWKIAEQLIEESGGDLSLCYTILQGTYYNISNKPNKGRK